MTKMFEPSQTKAIVVTGILLAALVIALWIWRGSRINVYRDDARTRASIAKHIPRGSSSDYAKQRMEHSGFWCRIEEVSIGEGQLGERLYCGKERRSWASLLAKYEWRISFTVRDGAVTDITVIHGMTGP